MELQGCSLRSKQKLIFVDQSSWQCKTILGCWEVEWICIYLQTNFWFWEFAILKQGHRLEQKQNKLRLPWTFCRNLLDWQKLRFDKGQSLSFLMSFYHWDTWYFCRLTRGSKDFWFCGNVALTLCHLDNLIHQQFLSLAKGCSSETWMCLGLLVGLKIHCLHNTREQCQCWSRLWRIELVRTTRP